MHDRYEAPSMTVIGSVHDVTLEQLDKIGSTADFLTDSLPQLDGDFVPDS